MDAVNAFMRAEAAEEAANAAGSQDMDVKDRDDDDGKLNLAVLASRRSAKRDRTQQARCHFCGYVGTAHNLPRRIKSRHFEKLMEGQQIVKMFICQHCGERFARSDAHRQHENKAHSISAMDPIFVDCHTPDKGHRLLRYWVRASPSGDEWRCHVLLELDTDDNVLCFLFPSASACSHLADCCAPIVALVHRFVVWCATDLLATNCVLKCQWRSTLH